MMAGRDSVIGASIRLGRHDDEGTVLLGPVRGSPPRQRGAALLEGMVARASSCMRRAAGGDRAQIVRYGRFLANEKVTLQALLAGWSEQTELSAAGRHVLAIQDTSEINFKTTSERRRGLGEVAGEVWTRPGRITVPHAKRPLEEKESRRWLSTAERAKKVLKSAACVTVIDDREGDIYAKWASVATPTFHLLTRSMHDRALADGASLYATAAAFPLADIATIDLPARANRPARQAKLSLRFGRVAIKRPQGAARSLPKSVDLTLIEVVEDPPPAGAEPLHWRLLTTHNVADAPSAWRIVEWYKKRWTIEQLFRLMKKEGLQLEDSRLETADRLLKLAAIAAKAAAITLQLVQARDGQSAEPASLALNEQQIEVLAALAAKYKGRTTLQSNPHPAKTLAWAAWIIARLGGWDGYPRTKPGPITMRHGLQYFLGVAQAWSALKDV